MSLTLSRCCWTQTRLSIIARRERVVASFSVLSAMGRLTAEALALPTPAYDPTHHYREVRGKFIGVSTPDGR